MCNHGLAEKDTAVADGLCPLCLQKETKKLRTLLRYAQGYVGYFAEGLDSDEEDVDLYNRIEKAINGHATDPVE